MGPVEIILTKSGQLYSVVKQKRRVLQLRPFKNKMSYVISEL